MKYYNELLAEDLAHIVKHTTDIWKNFKNKTIFITGGTGFFGKWFLETFAYVNHKLNLDCKIIVLSRNPEKFLNEFVYINNNPIFKFIKGDIRNFVFPEESVDYIIHAATESSAKLNIENPLLMFDTIVEGTRNVLNLAKEKKIKAFLFISSGAVYGEQPSKMTNIPEEYMGTPDCLNSKSAYGEGKRAAEMLCSIYNKQFQIPVKIARCFAFVGPYLPLSAHFAIGNFIYDGLYKNKIIIKGDGTPYRSYLYIADLIIWLWTILICGKSNYPYNVGSNKQISIKNIAKIVSKSFNKEIFIDISPKVSNSTERKQYVPSVKRAKRELNLDIYIPLADSIKKTINYYQNLPTNFN